MPKVIELRKYLVILFSSNEAFLMAQMIKNLPAHARDVCSVPGSGRSPGGGNGSLLQYSYLENPMDRRTWWATVHGVTKSQAQLSIGSTSPFFRNLFNLVPLNILGSVLGAQ